MRRGYCVKCGSASVHAAVNGLQLGERPEVRFRPHLEPGFRGMVQTHSGQLATFVCIRCGHLEFQVLDDASRQFVAANWARVEPAADSAPPP